MALSFGIAAQSAPWTVWSVVLLVHSIPAAISVQVQTIDELLMAHGSNISAAIPLRSAAGPAVATPCAPFNDDTCLHHLYWGGGYTCASATQWCHSWGKDMQRCCSLACGTAYLTETACNEMVSAGTCTYPHSGSGACEGATPSPASPPMASMAGASLPGGYGSYPLAAPAATPSPTTLPMSSMAGASTFGAAAAAPVAATGDPHLRNVHGEEFDLMEPGKHVLIQIPRKPLVYTLLRVDAEVQTLGGQCADMYFQELNITGAWADVERSGGFHYHARSVSDKPSHWIHVGDVQLKVAHGRTHEGTRYLNFYVRNLARSGFAVGGLLGDDDHTEAAMSPEGCAHRLAL